MKRLLLLCLIASPVFAQHTYWRMFQYSLTQPEVCQLIFKDASNVTISTAGGTASGSGPGGAPANAFNGVTDCSTLWATGGTGQRWLEMQFPSPVSVDHINIVMGQDGFGPGPNDVGLEYSDNNSTWTSQDKWFGIYSTPGVVTTWALTQALARPRVLGIAWRVNVPTFITCLSIQNLKFYDSGGTLLSAARYAALSSSISSGANAGWLGVDPSYPANPFFTANGSGPGYLAYEFSTLQTLSKIKISETGNFVCSNPLSFTVDYSFDEVTWVTANSFVTTWPSGAEQTFNITGGPGGFVPTLTVIAP